MFRETMVMISQAQPSGTIKNLKELKAPYASFQPGVFDPDPESFGNIRK